VITPSLRSRPRHFAARPFILGSDRARPSVIFPQRAGCAQIQSVLAQLPDLSVVGKRCAAKKNPGRTSGPGFPHQRSFESDQNSINENCAFLQGRSKKF
jgi:hypothetical protein